MVPTKRSRRDEPATEYEIDKAIEEIGIGNILRHFALGEYEVKVQLMRPLSVSCLNEDIDPVSMDFCYIAFTLRDCPSRPTIVELVANRDYVVYRMTRSYWDDRRGAIRAREDDRRRGRENARRLARMEA